jgi:putative transposase
VFAAAAVYEFQFMRKQRHSSAEIATKLRQSDAMSKDGVAMAKIAEALGISVMTYHRWRKAREAAAAAMTGAQLVNTPVDGDQLNRIKQLELENSRLRRLLADILLEKAELQESVQKRG